MSALFDGRDENGTMGPLFPHTALQVAAGKGRKTQANLFVLPAPLALRGTLPVIPAAGSSPPVPANSPSSFE